MSLKRLEIQWNGKQHSTCKTSVWIASIRRYHRPTRAHFTALNSLFFWGRQNARPDPQTAKTEKQRTDVGRGEVNEAETDLSEHNSKRKRERQVTIHLQ